LWFKTHYRRPLLLTENTRSLVYDVLSEVATREDYHLLDTDIGQDNLRLLISLKSSQSVSDAVKLLKGNVSRQFGLVFEDKLNAYRCRSLWAKGFFARSSGKVNLTRARNYLDSQAVHHGYKGTWTRELSFRNPAFRSPAFKLAHSLCMLDYHFVVATQDRLPLLDEGIAPRLFEYIMAIGRKHHFAVDRIGVMPDHMHLIIESVPSLSAEECVRAVLENTRHWMTKHYSGVLRQMNAWNVWEPSFYAGTVGEYSTAQVRQFLKMS
jgi:REP-associated tyrosine transposase